jgi:RNA polymerase sigma-70 factor (ECF subfamily)
VKSRVSRARKALEAVLESGGFQRDGAPAGEAMGLIMADAERLSAQR